jgi:hypothetical protein
MTHRLSIVSFISLASVLLYACGGGSATHSGSTGPALENGKTLFLDVHDLGPGKVTAQAVAEAHDKDLAVQARHGVSFKRYWVDEEAGKVYCLSEAPDARSVVRTHEEAHGLLPDSVAPVVQGQ